MNRTIQHFFTLAASLFFCFLLQACTFDIKKNDDVMKNSSKKWSDIAIRDIQKIHEVLSESHPAKLDESNLEFNAWLDLGYKEAIFLAENSKSEDQAFAAVKFYVTGFMDEHLVIWKKAHKSNQLYWAGWHVTHRNGRYHVTSRVADWPVETPQIGDEVISCDGFEVQKILSSKVAPFVDRRMHLDNTLNRLSMYITVDQADSPLWEPFRPTHCTIQKPNGMHQKIQLIWQKQPKDLKIRRQPAPQQGMHQIKNGVYWIHASNFMLDSEESVRFENLLNEVRLLYSADAIILDTRGNNGGNSIVGSRLLFAILKDAKPDHEDAKAYWRVSSLARATLESHSSSALQIEGKEGASYKWLISLIEAMEAATLRGDAFAEQLNISIKDDTEISHDRLPFRGKLLLITDSHCNSACLDFVDEVMSVPGALHIGHTTNADTRYIDVGSVTLPSGLKMWTPLKVWVGRRRQDNVPYVPQITYHQDINDTEALQAWVLQSILPLAKNIGTP